MNETDPLDGADVGETCEITHVEETPLVNVEPDVFWRGGDRDGTVDNVDAELVETEDGSRFVRYTYEGEVTKCLPRNWDDCEEPRTASEERTAMRARWKRRLRRAAAFLLPVGIGIAITTFAATQVMNAVANQPATTVEFSAPPTAHVAVYVVLFSILAVIISWAITTVPQMGRMHR